MDWPGVFLGDGESLETIESWEQGDVLKDALRDLFTRAVDSDSIALQAFRPHGQSLFAKPGFFGSKKCVICAPGGTGPLTWSERFDIAVMLFTTFHKRLNNLDRRRRTKGNLPVCTPCFSAYLPDSSSDDTTPSPIHNADTKCIVCYTDDVNIVARPCGHAVLCRPCFERLRERNRAQCMTCRRDVHYYEEVPTNGNYELKDMYAYMYCFA